MLNRFPGPGVHAVRPEMSMSHRLAVSVALPPKRQLMPTMAMGSTEPLRPWSLASRSLNTDQENDEPSLPDLSVSVLNDRDLSKSLPMVGVLGGRYEGVRDER